MTDLFLLYIWILTVMIISLEIIATAPFKKAAEWSDKYPHILMKNLYFEDSITPQNQT